MRTTIRTTLLALAGLFSYQLGHAALVVNFSQVGADVVITASGTVDVTGLSLAGQYLGSAENDMFSAVGDQAAIRSVSAGNDIYFAPFLHPLFSNNIAPTNGVGAGDNFALFSDDFSSFFAIIVPGGHTNGPINGTLTFASTDLVSLGVNPLASGSWGAGADQALSITTGAAVIPEPATYLAMIGFIGLGLLLYRRRKSATATEC